MIVRTKDPTAWLRTWCAADPPDLYWCPDADRPPGDLFHAEPVDLDALPPVAVALWRARQRARYG